ncbi:MAG TPA: AbrB/MazE/SpoVT family DNA-binding domain-containing protein [Vicinamibacteria bacterium]|jgi:AbrB family looped-hinge helix DNA binding protein
MAKVTSKLQVTLPKKLASELGIRPGDDIEWSAAAGAIRITPVREKSTIDVRRRVELFDQATKRQQTRDKKRRRAREQEPGKRGWSREELYRRGRAD